ncbi:hypothetical protein B5C34_04895 [Pacificimonas flava]|uniref:DUF1206 domain-containing protein n=2 Tax=Pacificimonas TaxID=1960290 RepID=A0A219B3Z7_9SPHN|nr:MULTISPECIES: DUF1206 domain-containing protein [Pacificimonas]MBZ6377446.1 DUF1206 domain-containing protein [Pacificimonas aurantium]OWV32853.1 hypothetical protein B5C34_04895 [Pacificimonas flava]
MERITRLQTFARIGFLARGVVYILLGYFALTALGSQGTTDVLGAIKDAPLGNVLLALVGIGLLGYGVYRLYGAMIGIDAPGTGAKAAGKRIGHAASGVAHLFLGFIALRGVFSSSSPGGSGGSGTGEAAGFVTDFPGGEILLWIIGLGFLLAAVAQAKKAITAKFMYRLDPDVPGFAEPVGRAGFAARAVVFVVIGWTIVQAMLNGNPEAVGGIGQALNTLQGTGWLFTVVAVGLLLFGVFSLIMARYRTIRDDDIIARLKR